MRIHFKFIWLAIGIGILAGCAPLPAKSPIQPIIAKPELQQSLAGLARDPAFHTPDVSQTHEWWNSFQDQQLNRLIQMAINGNPTLVAAQARIDQSRQAARLVALDSGLRFNSDASVVRQHLSQNGLFPPPLGGSTLNEGDISVGTAFTLDWWGKNRALIQSAIGDSKATEAEQRAAELTLAGEVADAYFNWLDIIARINLEGKIVEKRRLALQLAESRLKRGMDSSLISSQLEVKLLQEQDNLKEMEAQSIILRNRLAALTGNGPDWGSDLKESEISDNNTFPLPQKLPLDLLAQRPDVVALKWRVEAAGSRIEVAKADFYPNVDLNLMLGLQSLDLGNWLSTKSWYASFGPAVHIPLFNVRTLSTRLGITETEYTEAVSQYNQAIIQAASQVADALTRVSSIYARKQLQHTATASAERSQRFQSERYESGLSDRLPVLDEEIATLAQHVRESKLQADHKLAMVSLFVALGGNYESSQE